MDKNILGKTGLEVSVIGIGGGGHSKLGLNYGKDEENAVAVIRKGIELGINLIDTSEVYNTEKPIGKAIQDFKREDIIISTKLSIWKDDKIKTPEEIEQTVDQELTDLQTDVIDIYHVHGVSIDHYPQVIEQVYPILVKMKQKGKLKYIGITEAFNGDTDHKMLTQAVKDRYWDVIMVGFNIFNPSAGKFILKETREKGIGVLGMHVVRKSFINQENLKIALKKHIKDGIIDPLKFDMDNPLGFLLEVGESLTSAAYRFCRYEPGIHSVMSGTGSAAHLETNISDIHKSPLTGEQLAKLNDLFGDLDCLNGEL